MKRIADALWNEPVLAATVINAVVVLLSTEVGVLPAWAGLLSVAISGPIVRRFTIPEKKLTRALDRVDHYEGSN
jgi:hypothetical protein